jgi:hypothetical protein
MGPRSCAVEHISWLLCLLLDCERLRVCIELSAAAAAVVGGWAHVQLSATTNCRASMPRSAANTAWHKLTKQELLHTQSY